LEFLEDSVVRCGIVVKRFLPRHYRILEFVWTHDGHRATKEEVKEIALFDDSLDDEYITNESGKARRAMKKGGFPWILCNERRVLAIRRLP
jgi:hypothetical protein